MFWLLYHDLDARTPKSLVLLDFAQPGKVARSYFTRVVWWSYFITGQPSEASWEAIWFACLTQQAGMNSMVPD